jgi:membrane associated rhomboid family serine protease
MQYMGAPGIGPVSTPAVIKMLIVLTAAISLTASLIQSFFNQFNLFPGPQILLALNSWGVSQGYIWQFITYLFALPSPISFSSLLYLLINLYVLWVIGTDLVEAKGKTAFLRFYFFIGAAAGAITLPFLQFAGLYASLAGPAAPLLAMLIAWMMRFPENELLLFFLVPIKVKWIVAGIISALLLVTLSEWNIPWFFFYLSAVLLGYLYAAGCWGWQTPFPWTAKLDRALGSMGEKIHRSLKKIRKAAPSSSKIVDIQTGKPVDEEEQFVEKMLAKISQYGESSLSWQEKKRLQQISEKRRQGKTG